MDLNETTLFVAVAEALSFTKAARALGIPISSVSRKVTALEQRLGVRLIERTPRRLALTEAGALYHERCARLLRELERAEADVRELQSVPRGTLRITAPPEYGEPRLERAILGFLSAHRDMQLDIHLEEQRSDLVRDRYDLAVRIGPLSDSSLIARRLERAARRLVASRAYLAAHGTPASPSDLEHHACLVHHAPMVWRFRHGKQITGVPVRGRLVANSYALLLAAARAGLGVAMVPARMCADDIESGQLSPLFDDQLIGNEIGIYAVYPSSKQPPAKLTRFLEALAAAFPG
jgi:DNA-binding transcriptional LysR family regulator